MVAKAYKKDKTCMTNIREAEIRDASRIAEILVFTKRTNYRRIFHDDKVSFGEIQVYPVAKSYIDEPKTLDGIWVYDDEFVKGMIHIKGDEVAELYVDPFFENEGIGSRLMDLAVKEKHCRCLWVLEKNKDAQRFYACHGFVLTDERRLEAGTKKYVRKMTCKD